MTEETDPKTASGDASSEAPGQPAPNHFEDFRDKTVSMARNHTRLFAFGVATILCGLLWFATAMTVQSIWALLSIVLLAGGFFLHPSNERLSRWLFAAAFGAEIAGAACWGSLPLLVCALALVGATPALDPHSRAFDAMAFVAGLAALFAVLFRDPKPIEHIGAVRGLVFLLLLGWAVPFFVLRSRPLPASCPAKLPRIALLAGLALAFVLATAWSGLNGWGVATLVPIGLLFAALLVFAMDEKTDEGAPGSPAGTWIRRYAPAATACLVVFTGFLNLCQAFGYYCQYGVGDYGRDFLLALSTWIPWLLLALHLAGQCGWLGKITVRRADSGKKCAVRDTVPATVKTAPGSMPVSWTTMHVIAWLVLVVWVVLGLTSLLSGGLRMFGVNGFAAAYCGVGALLMAPWFLFLAIFRKFAEGVNAMESHGAGIVRTPMCSAWTILYQLGMVMIVLLSIGLVATFCACLGGNLSGGIPFCLLLFLVSLAPHFLNLFLARRFHDAVCVLESEAGDKKPEPGPLPVSWHVTLVVLWILSAILLVTGVVLIVMALVPHGSGYRSWHEWGYLWIGVQCCLADIPLAFGFLFLFLVKRFWSAVACLRVLAFRPAGIPAPCAPPPPSPEAEPEPEPAS